MCVILLDMKTANERELQHHLKRILDVIDHGEEVVITRRNRRIAKIVPLRESTRIDKWPDFVGRARKVKILAEGKNPSELIVESREERI